MASRNARETSAATPPSGAATKHTPGPWSVHANTSDVGYIDPEWSSYQIRSEDWTLAMVLTDADAISSDANARLISAAPDLLEALKPFADACASADEEREQDRSHAWESPMAMAVTHGDFRRALAALSKARGKV